MVTYSSIAVTIMKDLLHHDFFVRLTVMLYVPMFTVLVVLLISGFAIHLA